MSSDGKLLILHSLDCGCVCAHPPSPARGFGTVAPHLLVARIRAEGADGVTATRIVPGTRRYGQTARPGWRGGGWHMALGLVGVSLLSVPPSLRLGLGGVGCLHRLSPAKRVHVHSLESVEQIGGEACVCNTVKKKKVELQTSGRQRDFQSCVYNI